MKRIDTLCKKSPVGKLLPDSLYVHTSAIDKLDFKLQLILCAAWCYSYTNENPTLIKISRLKPEISLLYYEDFDEIEHPALLKSIHIDYKEKKTKVTDFSKRLNRPILHRKETMVAKDYHLYDKFVSITTKEEAAGYYRDTKRIGTENGWLKTIKGETI